MGSTRTSTGSRVARIAARDHAVVTRAMLRAEGWTDAMIEHRVATGLLHRVHRGVFAVGHERLTDHGAWLAAVRAAGERAALSHVSAAALWGLLPRRPGPIHVTVGARRRAQPGIRHHRSALDDRSLAVRDRIPCTSVARTLVGVAATEGRIATERAWSTASSRRLLRLSDLEYEVRGGRGRAGVAIVRELHSRHAAGLGQRTNGELERLALRVLSRAGLPTPRCNILLRLEDRVYEPDMAWGPERLIIELDGRSAHGHSAAFQSDRERDAALQLAGWRVLRLTWLDLTRHERRSVERIRALLRQRPLEPAPR